MDGWGKSSEEKDVINIMTFFHKLTLSSFGSTFYYWSEIALAISHIKVFFIVNHFISSHRILSHHNSQSLCSSSVKSFWVISVHKIPFYKREREGVVNLNLKLKHHHHSSNERWEREATCKEKSPEFLIWNSLAWVLC